jgi:hypothetical protein
MSTETQRHQSNVTADEASTEATAWAYAEDRTSQSPSRRRRTLQLPHDNANHIIHAHAVGTFSRLHTSTGNRNNTLQAMVELKAK